MGWRVSLRPPSGARLNGVLPDAGETAMMVRNDGPRNCGANTAVDRKEQIRRKAAHAWAHPAVL
jgi:hypothetical protein